MLRLCLLRNFGCSVLCFDAVVEVLARHRQAGASRIRRYRPEGMAGKGAMGLEVATDGRTQLAPAEEERRGAARSRRPRGRSVHRRERTRLAGYQRLEGSEFKICPDGLS